MSRIRHATETFVNNLIKGVKQLISSNTEQINDLSGNVTKLEEDLGKRIGQRFYSVDGSNITVNNGIEGRLLGAEIKGQTVKNIFNKNVSLNLVSPSTGVSSTDFSPISIESNKVYTLAFKTDSTNSVGKSITLRISYYDVDGVAKSFAKSIVIGNDVSKDTVTTPSDIKSIFRFRIESNGTIDLIASKFMVLEGDSAKYINDYIPFGLSSTQAVISNNGQPNYIYEPVITGKTRILKAPKGTQNWVEISADETRDTAKFDYKLDSINGDFGSTHNVSDYVDRAKKVKVFTTKEIDLADIPSWTVSSQPSYSDFSLFSCSLPNEPVVSWGKNSGLCNAIVWESSYDLNREAIAIGSNKMLQISFTKTKAATSSAFKSYLEQQRANGTPVTIRYQLATPQEVSLTDEQFKAYDAHKKVISLGGVGDVKDTLEILDDGSAVYTQNVLKYLIDGSSKNKIRLENTIIIIDGSQGILGYSGLTNTTALISSKYIPTSWNNGYSTEGSIYMHPNGALFINNKESKTLEEVKLELSSNPIEVIGFIPSPLITHIPKELVPTILTHKTNIFSVGGSVKASSFYFDIPVEKLIYDNKSQIVENKLNKAVLEVEKQLALLEYQQLIGGDFNV